MRLLSKNLLDVRDVTSQQQSDKPNTTLRTFCSCQCAGVTEISVRSVLRTKANHVHSLRTSYCVMFPLLYGSARYATYPPTSTLALYFARDPHIFARNNTHTAQITCDLDVCRRTLRVQCVCKAESKPLDFAVRRLQRL
jgi:hypothetical protein